jgi:septal ring factor EnvC (AmiA/AmiB activator)
LSTLTKILIVLLTISSIFLCGIVVTYVANADDYRKQYLDLRSERDGLKETAEGNVKAFNEKKAEMERMEDRLNNDIASLNTEISTLKGDLKAANDERKIMTQRVSDMASVVETTTKTSSETTKMMRDTQAQLTLALAEKEKLEAQFDDTSATLLEKFAIIQTLQTEKKQLLEEKVELLSRMDRLLQPVGRAPAPVVTVTRPREIARPAPVIVKKIGLRGLVTAVDSKNKMASISIGTADGVKEGMKFHVTRGDKFICDILIIDTDAEEAVGALELLDLAREQPRAGDTVTINF